MTQEQKFCNWEEDEIGVWHTECGELHSLIDGSPADNKMRFCCYCGGKLAQCSYAEGLEDDSE